VIINGRTRDKVDKVAADIRRAVPGANIVGVAADVSEAAGFDQLVRAAPGVDILVNNAAICEPKDFFAIPDEDWRRFFETNIVSGVRLSGAYTPRMLELDWGRIVFISFSAALQTSKEMIHYGLTKTAQLAISRGLAELTACGRLVASHSYRLSASARSCTERWPVLRAYAHESASSARVAVQVFLHGEYVEVDDYVQCASAIPVVRTADGAVQEPSDDPTRWTPPFGGCW
jgi:short chain dehydrogenase